MSAGEVSSAGLASPSPATEISGETLSKRARKRAAKKEIWDSQKVARREKEKERKKEKKRLLRQRVEAGEIERPVTKRQLIEGEKDPYNARIVIDLGFDDKMAEKEMTSITTQLSHCYSINRTTKRPVKLLMTSLNGKTKARFEGVLKGVHESWRGIEWWEEPYTRLYEDAGDGEDLITVGKLKGTKKSTCKKEDIVYLTGDSPNVLSSIEENKTYIIGGIVDHNRYKFLCLDKANEQGIAHAQLPIGQYLPHMTTRKVLTVNHVFDIIAQFVLTQDWKTALEKVMPSRKLKNESKTDQRPASKSKRESGEAGEANSVEASVAESNAEPAESRTASEDITIEAKETATYDAGAIQSAESTIENQLAEDSGEKQPTETSSEK